MSSPEYPENPPNPTGGQEGTFLFTANGQADVVEFWYGDEPFSMWNRVPADQTGVFFILPTWQYDCQFYPSFRCDLGAATQAGSAAIVQRLVPALALFWILVAGWALVRYDVLRSLVSRARR